MKPPSRDPAHGLAQKLVESLQGTAATLVLAESCTGGLMAEAITSVPGASRVFWGSFVSYSPDAKHSMLGISPGLLALEGMVSEACLNAMLSGALAHSPATLAIAVTGYAGPEGGEPGSPVGTVWIGVSIREGKTKMQRYLFPGSRDEVRSAATSTALTMACGMVDTGMIDS